MLKNIFITKKMLLIWTFYKESWIKCITVSTKLLSTLQKNGLSYLVLFLVSSQNIKQFLNQDTFTR